MILVAGFPYIRENYFATFRHWPEREGVIFFLPKVWKIKGGKVVFYPPKDQNVITGKILFFHSQYPIIGGVLKGWMPAFPLVLWRLRKRIKLVYASSEPNLLSTFYFNFWSKLFGLKCINFTWENIPYWEKSSGLSRWTKGLIVKLSLTFSDGIVCGNSRGKEIFKKLTKKPIAVIPMSGIDANIFQRKGGRKTFNGYDWSSKIVFTFAGSISYRKGLLYIIEAFKQVAEKIPQAQLFIAGSGEYEKELETEIKNSGIDDRITRIPWLEYEKLPRLLEASDVFLYPSISYGGWEEQFGYSMAEASLMELPVIATRSGSIGDVVIDGETGILVEPGSAGALRDAMIKLASDLKLRKEMGRAGREHIVKNFSHQVVAQKFYGFFKKFI